MVPVALLLVVEVLVVVKELVVEELEVVGEFEDEVVEEEAVDTLEVGLDDVVGVDVLEVVV